MRSEMLSYFLELLASRLQEAEPGLDIPDRIETRGRSREPMDEAERACAHIEEEMAVRFQLRSHRLARELRDALRRIRVGEFGICERCGDDIDINRLKAQPTSTVCIGCKRKMESFGKSATASG